MCVVWAYVHGAGVCVWCGRMSRLCKGVLVACAVSALRQAPLVVLPVLHYVHCWRLDADELKPDASSMQTLETMRALHAMLDTAGAGKVCDNSSQPVAE